MDDRRIEELLRRSWKPEPPQGMRDRALRKAREAARAPERRFVFLSPRAWLTAAAVAVLTIVAFTGISEHARQARIAEMFNGHNSAAVNVASASLLTYRDWQRELDRILAE